jgi:hypothetical protein
MKITIEPYSGGEFSGTNDAEHISEVIELFKGLLVASGYHPKTVDDFLSVHDEGWALDVKSLDSEDDECPGTN